MANEFKVRKGLIVQGSGSNIFDVQGSQGQLFSVTDSLSGSLFSVNDISGIPIMEVFSDNTIKMGTFNQEAIIVSGSRTGMGIATPQAELHISGANNDSLFRIQSPASASIIFVTGSGLVGIGTLTPTQKLSVDNGNVGFTSGFGISWDSDTEWIKRAAASDQLQIATQNTVRLNIGSTQGQLVAIGLGTTAASAQFQVRGGGATAASTAMRIEDSGGNARLTILDDGTSAFNTSHLYVSSSGNVGIGTTTPNTKLEVSGLVRITGTNGFSIGSDSGRNRIQYSTSTFSRFALLTSGNNYAGLSAQGLSIGDTYGSTAPPTSGIIVEGSVGIGTTNPIVKLHISQSSGEFQRVDINNTNADGVNATTRYYTNTGIAPDFLGATSFRLQGGTTDAFKQFQVYIADLTSPRFIINGSGNVGIGTTSPSVRLHISGTSATNELVYLTGDASQGSAIRFNRGSSYSWRMGVVPNSNFTIEDVSYSITRFQINNTSGLIGINTISPNARLHISGANNEALLIASSSTAPSALFVSGSGNVGIGTATPTSLLQVAGRITSTELYVTNGDAIYTTNGSVGIGTSGPTSTNRLQVRGSGATSATTALRIENSAATARLTILDDGTSAFNTSHLYISSSGNVGIGTATPTSLLQVAGRITSTELYVTNGDAIYTTNGSVGIGTSGPTSTNRLQVRGSGATSATTALRIENSAATARLTILDDGTSAFNTSHLYISSSGNIGISTTTPSDLLTINSPSNTGSLRLTHLSEIETLRATSFHSGLYIGNNIYYNGSGDPITNSSYAVDSGSNNRGGNLLLMRANNGTTALGGFYFYTAPSSSIANTTATLNESFRIIPSSSFFTNTRVGIGAAANTSYAFDIQSSAPNSGAARINGNNTVWVFDQASQVTRGTTTLSRMFLVQMGPVNASSGTQTALTVSQSISQSSTAGYTTLVVNANETGTGSGNKLLQAWQFNGTDRTVINNSGSLGIGIATPSASLHISGANNQSLLQVSSPSASAALFISGSGNVGVGTATPAGLIDIFQGGNSRILVTTDNGFVGLQQPSPTERIHITSDPVNGKYLQIDAGQTSNAPRQVVDSPATAIIGSAAGDSTVYLSEPRWWMEIKLDGNIALIPCYQPDV